MERARDRCADEAEQEALARSELLARLTHEVASPLGVVAGALQELRGCVPRNAETERYFRLAERALERLVRLSRELDEAADLEETRAHGCHLERELTDLRDVVQAAIERVSALEPRAGEVVETRLPATPVRAEVDAGRLTRVVDLLLAASLRFARSYVRIGVEEGERGLELYIEDDGPAIPEPFRDRLFERFGARLPPGRDRGVVFGLSIARDYVVAHGGRITIEDVPEQGGGARLRVILPGAPSRQAAR